MADDYQTVAFVSLGCSKNLVDSESMLGQLAAGGLAVAPEDEADVIVVNTCGFLESAKEESLGVIRQALERKRAGLCKRVVVAGCLAQRMGRSLLEEAPGIDAVVGVNNRDDIAAAVRPGRTRDVDLYLGRYHEHVLLDSARFRLTPRHYAYLRISEGCGQRCTFCAIPSIRGPLHSKPLRPLLDEARELVEDGAVELILIGQETSSYGHDLGGAPRLAELLRQLDQIDGVRWIRLMYAYPTTLDEATIDAMAECPQVVKYVDMPLQHINDRILRAMHRRMDRADTEALLDRIRRRMPEASIRTTLIAGFPGETDEEFAELLAFVRNFGFDMLGVFPYSQEPGTPAARMKHQVPPAVARERVEALMLAQQEIAFAKAEAMIGKRLEVLIDGPAPDGAGRFARHCGQAPEVDSRVIVAGSRIRPGRFAKVRVIQRCGYDLAAEPINRSLPVMAAADHTT